MIRPEVLALVVRGRDVGYGAGAMAFGLWLIWLGGVVLVTLGAAVIALGVGWAVLAWRRMRFAQGVDAPGVVEVDEGQIGYLGPSFGGYVALPDLAELRILTLQGRRLWRLKQADGQVLLIPVDAAGADQLFDAFASLPGMDTATLMAALQPDPPGGANVVAMNSANRVVWQRQGRRALR